jgi:hypothetical protein
MKHLAWLIVLAACGGGTAGNLDSGGNDSGTTIGMDSGGADSGSSTTNDSGVIAIEDSGVVVECTGAHPIIGPPRRCNDGSCLCVETDTCYDVTVAAACCAGTNVCDPPDEDCMQTHPIVGPPRTCEPGRCYCGNPDACFPADRADRCCAGEVVCVPST